MTGSSLVTKVWPANPSNYTIGRGGYEVVGIVIHHAVTTDINVIGRVFEQYGRGGSAHYGVGGKEVHQYVDETNTAWHCSNFWGNENTIGIECVNSALGGDYPVSDETLDTVIRLVADIAKRYNLGKLYVNPSEDCPKISGHRDWQGAQTYCMPLDATEVLTSTGFVKLDEITMDDFVAQWDQKTMEVSFAQPKGIIDPYTAEVKRIRNTELTDDHVVFTKEIEHRRNSNRGKWTGKYVEKKWGSGSRFTFPTETEYHGKGLGELTPDEVELLMWIQADGHYMYDKRGKGCHYGIEFHFKKQRKIDRVVALLENLGIDYTFKSKKDGTASIRIFGNEHFEWAEYYLTNKEFNYCWMDLNDEQYRRFREVIELADGCVANHSYSSKSQNNIDIVQAILQLHGQTSVIYNEGRYPRLFFGAHTYSLDGRAGESRRTTEVGCLTMPEGTLIIRQYGKVQLVGNCPGDYLYARLQYIADRANDINFPPEPPKPTVEWHDVPETTLKIKDGGTDLVDVTNGNIIKHLDGDFTFVQMTNDDKYVRTQYSKEKGINNGVLYSDLLQPEPIPEPTPEPTPTPQPDPQPEPTDDTPNWFIRFIHALGEFFINLFVKKED